MNKTNIKLNNFFFCPVTKNYFWEKETLICFVSAMDMKLASVCRRRKKDWKAEGKRMKYYFELFFYMTCLWAT